MKIPLILTYLLNLFDLAFTMCFVDRFGIEIERNPLGRWLIQSGNVYFAKIVLVGVALLLLYQCTKAVPNIKWVCWIPFAIYSVLAVYHIVIASIVF